MHPNIKHTEALSYEIYQLKDEPESRRQLFIPLERLERMKLTVRPELYEMVYKETLTHEEAPATDQKLMDQLFIRFNITHPDSFSGHSLSISDVIVIQRDNARRAYYVDTVGFTELPSFPARGNPLRTAELSLEQNANQIDGQINNLPTVEDKLAPLREKAAANMRKPKHAKTVPER